MGFYVNGEKLMMVVNITQGDVIQSSYLKADI